jgi:hypothetical protein
MMKKNKFMKKNPLSKAQNKLLKESLKRLLGNGLIQEVEPKKTEDTKEMVIRNALNAIILNGQT